MGMNDFAIFVGTSVQEETSQPCLIFLISLEYGIVMYIYLPHISLSSFTNTSFTSITTYTSRPQNMGVNDFAFFVGTSVQEEMKGTEVLTLGAVG